MAIFYLDYVNGNDANDGSSWSLAWKTITAGATAARIAPGDTIRIAKSPTPTSTGINAAWTNLSRTVTLASALTANIELCETAWTGTANVTVDVFGTRKQGSYSARALIAAAFTTGKIAYKTIALTDFSSYQQVSFWIQTSVAIAAGVLTLNLCSDTAGDVPVNTIAIPAIPGANRWQQITVNTSAPLGSSIQSVALFAVSDPGIPVILLDNIIACKAVTAPDSLTLSSLISKNNLEQYGEEGWYGIKSIVDSVIELDVDTNSAPGIGRGYWGTTETVPFYKRETIKTIPAPSLYAAVQEVQDTGIADNPIAFQGGYNTVTGLQDGETIFDGQNGMGNGLSLVSKRYIVLNNIYCYRYCQALYFENAFYNTIGVYTGGNNSFAFASNSASFCNNLGILKVYCNSTGISISGHNNTIDLVKAFGNDTYGIQFMNGNNNVVASCHSSNNGHSGLSLSAAFRNIINQIEVKNNRYYGYHSTNSSDNTARNLISANNGICGVFHDRGVNYLHNALMSEAVKVGGPQARASSRLFSQRQDNTPGNHYIYTDAGYMLAQTTVRRTTPGLAWQLSPTDAGARIITYPLDLRIARINCVANKLVTVTAWFRRDNVEITGRLICRGMQIAGINADVIAYMTVGAGLWEQLTIGFTPTTDGSVDIFAEAYGGSTHNVYVDDMTVAVADTAFNLRTMDFAIDAQPNVTNYVSVLGYSSGSVS